MKDPLLRMGLTYNQRVHKMKDPLLRMGLTNNQRVHKMKDPLLRMGLTNNQKVHKMKDPLLRMWKPFEPFTSYKVRKDKDCMVGTYIIKSN